MQYSCTDFGYFRDQNLRSNLRHELWVSICERKGSHTHTHTDMFGFGLAKRLSQSRTKHIRIFVVAEPIKNQTFDSFFFVTLCVRDPFLSWPFSWPFLVVPEVFRGYETKTALVHCTENDIFRWGYVGRGTLAFCGSVVAENSFLANQSKTPGCEPATWRWSIVIL